MGQGNGLFECHIAASLTKTLALSRVRFEAASTAEGVFEFVNPGSCLPRFNLPRHVARSAHGVASDVECRAASELATQAEFILTEPDVIPKAPPADSLWIDRDRGTPHDATPPTPPGIRVRTTAVRPS